MKIQFTFASSYFFSFNRLKTQPNRDAGGTSITFTTPEIHPQFGLFCTMETTSS